jgi:Lrp/AsnC family leucine-responsive transcriptional regulator
MADEQRILDGIDRQILNILQSDGRIANVAITRRVGLAPSAVLERIRKLEERGVISGYTARVNAAAVGQGLLAFVLVRTEETGAGLATPRRLAQVPEVQEVHNIAGEDCYLLKVRVRDTEALGRLLREKIGAVPAVRSTRTTIVLETLKEGSAVPVAGDAPARPPARRRRP